jgi:hypothetical protein
MSKARAIKRRYMRLEVCRIESGLLGIPLWMLYYVYTLQLRAGTLLQMWRSLVVHARN